MELLLQLRHHLLVHPMLLISKNRRLNTHMVLLLLQTLQPLIHFSDPPGLLTGSLSLHLLLFLDQVTSSFDLVEQGHWGVQVWGGKGLLFKVGGGRGLSLVVWVYLWALGGVDFFLDVLVVFGSPILFLLDTLCLTESLLLDFSTIRFEL